MAQIIRPHGWQGITRIDQRVICVALFESACSVQLEVPQHGVIYRVAGFAECASGEPGIFLREIESRHCYCWDKKLPFQLVGFRPVDEAEKKNEHVTKMLDDILKETKIDTRVPEDA